MATIEQQPFNTGRFACEGVQVPTSSTSLRLPSTERERYSLLERYAAREDDTGTDGEGSPVLSGFGFLVRWRSDLHVPPSALEPLRSIGDDLGDAAAREIKRRVLMPCKDGKRQPQGIDFLHSIAGESQAARNLIDHATAMPPWVDWDRVRRGQQFFLRNIGPIGLALLNLSLIGGFGAPKINAVLDGSGYLSRGNGTARRLSETLQMVLDCCVDAGSAGTDNALRPWNKGWRSVMNVRLLHAGVRTWLMQTHHHSSNNNASHPSFDQERYGVPIDQEDLLVTQAAFSSVVCIGLERCGLLSRESESDEEVECYWHLWRVIGFLIGIDDSCYPAATKALANKCDELRGGQALLESIAAHLVLPDPSSRRIALHVISSVSYRPPVPRTPYLHILLTRRLAGEEYADSLGIPRIDDDDLLELDEKAKEKGERETREREEKEAAARRKMKAERGWLWWMPSFLSSSSSSSPTEATGPLYLAPEEGDDALVTPSSTSRNANNASALSYCTSGLKFVAWISLVLPLTALMRIVSAAFGVVGRVRGLVLAGRRRLLTSVNENKSKEQLKAEKIATAKKIVELVFSRYRLISRLTRLPLVGGLIARLLASTLVGLIEAQLGGRTDFPIRRRYL